jgi:TonB family protein
MAMSYRSIALVSCLVLVGCGSAPPPSAEAARAASDPSTGAAAAASAGLSEAKPMQGQGALPTDDGRTVGAPPPPPPPPHGASVPEGGKKSERVGQAVVDTSEPISGKLTQADIGRILEKNGDVFGDCYTLGAGGKMKDFRGVVTVKATIGPSGTVNQVDVTKSTANNPKVDACVREAFKKIKFPKPRDGATSVITFPISFNGVEQVN